MIAGRNPIIEALRSGRPIERIVLQHGAAASAAGLADLAQEHGVRIDYAAKSELDRLAGGTRHQGAVAFVSAYSYSTMAEVEAKAAARGTEPLVLVLDGIEDPHNLGAILRSAECAGASGVIVPARRSAGLTETVARTSAGAIEYMPCVRVVNIARTLEELKREGYWICCADMDGRDYRGQDLTGKLAIVIGNEGRGVSRLVREKCDFVVSIPIRGRIESLNASNAAAVLLYEALRQREAHAE